MKYEGACQEHFICSPWSRSCADKELGTIGVGASIGHGQTSGTGVFQDEVLIGKLVSVNGLSTSSVVFCEVTTLQPQLEDLRGYYKSNKLQLNV